LLEPCLAAKLDKSKRQEWPFKLLPLSSKATKSGSKFSLGYLFLMENLVETLQWFFNYIFNGNKGGFIVKKMVGKFSFFGYSQWKQKGGGRGWGVLMVRSNPQLYSRKWSLKVLKTNSYFTIGNTW